MLALDSLHVRTQPSERCPFLHYFSSNRLLTSGATQGELTLHRDALAKVINHLSWKQQIVRPKEIEPTNTVFVLDIRDVGWNQQPFEQIVEGKPSVRSKLNLYDLVLLEYPYSLVYEDSDAWRQLAEGYLGAAGLVRPIPFVRADWFVSIASLPLLYEDPLQLPFDLSQLETKLGVDSAVNLRDGAGQRAGMTLHGAAGELGLATPNGLTDFAATDAFESGVLLRGKDVVDRVVHPFFALNRDDGSVKAGFDPGKLIKKTIAIETR